MPRPRSTAPFPWFKHDLLMSQDPAVEALEARRGLIGYAVYNKLLERIYTACGTLDLQDPQVLGSAVKHIGVPLDDFLAIVSDCIYVGLFEEAPWKESRILTSRRIREQLDQVLSERDREREKKAAYRASHPKKAAHCPPGQSGDKADVHQGQSPKPEAKDDHSPEGDKSDVPVDNSGTIDPSTGDNGVSPQGTNGDNGGCPPGTSTQEVRRIVRKKNTPLRGVREEPSSFDWIPDQEAPRPEENVDDLAELKGALREAFGSKNLNLEGKVFYGSRGDWAKEIGAIDRLAKLCRGKWPGMENEAAGRMLRIFQELTESRDPFFRGKPFRPSFVASAGVFPQLAMKVDEEISAQVPAVQQEAMPYG